MKSKYWIRAYAISFAAVLAAVVTRWVVEPWLGNFVPLVTLYGAVALAVWAAGYRAAVLAAVGGYLAIDLLFTLPSAGIRFMDQKNLIGLGLYLVSCALIIGVGEAMRRERRRAQVASEQVQIVTNTMAAGVTRCSRDMRYLWVNQSYCDWIRRPAHELVGRPIADIVGAEAMEQLLPYFQRVLAGETVRYEKEVAFQSVGPGWISVTYTPTRNEDGEIDGWVAVVIDVGARKRVEDELRRNRERIQNDLDALTRLHGVSNLCGGADHSFDDCVHAVLDAAIAFTHADRGNIQLLNREDNTLRLIAHCGFEEPFLSFFSTVSAEEGSACGRAMRERGRVLVEDVAQDQLFRGEASQSVLLDAGVRAVQSTPLLTSSGQLIGMISTHYARARTFDARELRWMDVLARQAADYLDRKHGEEALREADRKKDEFLAMLSHELRNPLAPIGYAAEILKKSDPAPAQLAKAREVIDRQVRQMARLLDDLMDVSRITRGTISLRRQSVALAAVVNDAVEATRPFIEQSGNTLRIDVPSDPVMLDADGTRLSQVLINLLNNAAKYTEHGGSIELNAARADGFVVIRVKDSGVGIPAEMLPRVFELFTQEERSIDRAHGGLGIGLTLARRLVSLHGGTLEAHSEGAGRGSEFVVRLPVAPGNYAPAVGNKPEKTNGARHLRILVVDDNDDSADTMAMFLESNGHEVRTANNGLDAVETAAAFQPAAVLLDIGLPKLNGYDAATRIRAQRGSDVMLVALTGWGQESDRRRSREAGFDHHLTKPVELDQLQRLLSAAKGSFAGP